MRIRNTSKYPDAEVKRLVEFGFHGVADAGTVVNVKNARYGYRGRAYHGVPSMSPVAKLRTACQLVTLGIGPASDFPTDNMYTTTRWQELDESQYEALTEDEQKHIRTTQYHEIGQPIRWRYQRAIVSRHPYGGKSSPLIVTANWREALVSIAAHEGRHIWQNKNHKPASEVDAERFAAKAVARFRAEQEIAA